MEDEIRPLVNDYWKKDQFPFEIIDKFKKNEYRRCSL